MSLNASKESTNQNQHDSSKERINENVVRISRPKQSNIFNIPGFQKRRHTSTHGCDGCNDVGETSVEKEQIKPTSDQESLESAKIKEACNLWQDRWQIDYPWLEFNRELGKVFCKVCMQQPKRLKNVFGSVGSTNFRSSAFLDHGRSKQHKDIYKDQMEAERNAIRVANMTIRGQKEETLWTLFRVAYYIARENLAYTKFQSMLQLLRVCGVKTITKSLYQHDKACAEFIKYIGDSLRETLLERVKQSPVFGIMVDESTDISDSKSLVVYVTYLVDCSPTTSYLCLTSIANEDAEALYDAIISIVNTSNLDIRKFVGFGSDGAGVMIGSISGVATRLKAVCPFLSSIHCVAHRCNLACAGPASKLPYAKFLDALVNSTVAFFANSCKRLALLRSLELELANDVLKLTRVNSTRWLSRHGSIKRLCDVLQPVIHAVKTELNKFSKKRKNSSQYDEAIDLNEDAFEAALSSTSKSRKEIQAAAAKKLLESLCDFKNLYCLHFLVDILGRLSILSLTFQRDYIEVGAISGIVSSEIATIQLEYIEDPLANLNAGTCDSKGYPLLPEYGPEKGYLRRLQSCLRGNMYYDIEIRRCILGSDLEEAIAFQKTFSNAIVDGLSRQFKDMGHLGSFKALSPINIPKCMREMKDYGYSDINKLGEFYAATKVDNVGTSIPPLIDLQDARAEYKTFKIQAMTDWAGRSFRDTWSMIGSNEQLKEKYKGLHTLACIALVQCANSAACERGFSRLNLIKDKRRNSLESMDALMRISIEGSADVESVDFSAAIRSWATSAEYRHIFFNTSDKML